MGEQDNAQTVRRHQQFAVQVKTRKGDLQARSDMFLLHCDVFARFGGKPPLPLPCGGEDGKHKSEIRSPKAERRPKSEARINATVFRISGFGFRPRSTFATGSSW